MAMLQALRARARRRGRAQYDVVLTPSLAEAPVPHGTIDPRRGRPDGRRSRAPARSRRSPPIANITGSPAISLPLYHDDEAGLPIGVQLIGQPAGEGDAARAGAQLEAARPWHDRHASV